MTKQGKKIIFIVGLILLVTPLNLFYTYAKYIKFVKAPYHMSIESKVIEVSKVISRSTSEEDIGELRSTQYAYNTEEIFETDLGVQKYEGYYSIPYTKGDFITHHIYRYKNDTQWTVYDFDKKDLIIKGVACLFMGLVGAIILIQLHRVQSQT